jgi:site-specific recombinase XerC
MSASQLKHEFLIMAKRNKDGSFATQKNRLSSLVQMSKQINQLGYRVSYPSQLKPKHVDALVSKWKEDGITDGVMKNRLSNVRWWAEKVGKSSVVRSDNLSYGIKNRVYVTNEDKGKVLDQGKLDQVNCEFVKTSLQLQEAFGLRREESIKFDARFAVKDNKIILKASWCKGGKQRSIPIETDKQRQVLQRIERISPNGCLIPRSKNYIQQLRRYEVQTKMAGLNQMHGLRHRYAQDKYKALTGTECKARGGLSRKDMTKNQLKLDTTARQTISRLLGHERLEITNVYLGS